MINLDGVQPFAEGGNRRCYVHPENSYRCLKVTIQDQSKIAKQNAPWYKKFRSESTFDDNIREQKAYAQRALKKIILKHGNILPDGMGWLKRLLD